MRELALPGRPLSGATRRQIERLVREGVPVGVVAARVGCSRRSVLRVRRSGGSWLDGGRGERWLSRQEREEISRGVRAGESLRQIAVRLGRSASTVSREVARNGGRRGYRGWRAEQAAWQRARRPKPRKLQLDAVLAAVVERMLAERLSPQQASARLRLEFPHDARMQVSPETIYQSLYLQGRGGLRKSWPRRCGRVAHSDCRAGTSVAGMTGSKGSCRSANGRRRPMIGRCPAIGKATC